MTNWKYIDASNASCHRINEQGHFESQMTVSEEIQKWIADGNTPTPADAPTPAQVAALALAAARNAEIVAVKADPAIVIMTGLTPTAQAAAIDALTTLPQLKAEVRRLAMIVNVLAKRL